jgi:hypothetical protein
METDLILGIFMGVIIVSAVIVVVLVAVRRAGYRRVRRLQPQKETGVNIRRAAPPESSLKSRPNEKPRKVRKQDAPENIFEYNRKAPSVSEGNVTRNTDSAPSFGRTDQTDSGDKRLGKMDSLPAAAGENAAAIAEQANEAYQKQPLKNEPGDLTSLFTDTLMEESREGKFAKNLNNVDIQDLLTQIKTMVKSSKKSD